MYVGEARPAHLVTSSARSVYAAGKVAPRQMSEAAKAKAKFSPVKRQKLVVAAS